MKISESGKRDLQRLFRKQRDLSHVTMCYMPRTGVNLEKAGLVKRAPGSSCDYALTDEGKRYCADLERENPANRFTQGYVAACAVLAKQNTESEGKMLASEGGISFESARDDGADDSDLRAIWPEEFNKEPL